MRIREVCRHPKCSSRSHTAKRNEITSYKRQRAIVMAQQMGKPEAATNGRPEVSDASTLARIRIWPLKTP